MAQGQLNSGVRRGVRYRIAALLSLLASTAHGGFIKSWGIGEFEQSPVLAVCTVEDIVKREPVAAGTVRWSGSYRWHEATLRVERVFSKLPSAPTRGDRIVVRYVSFGDVVAITGSPIWPVFEKGQRAVFPLSPSKDRPDRWSLVADEGFNVTVPATGKEWRRAEALATPRGFMVTELINALASGSPAEQFAATNYMREGSAVPPEAQRALDAAIGNDEERWLAVASSIVSSLGVPRPSLAEIMAGTNQKDSFRGPVLDLLSHALQKSTKLGFPDRLIVKLIDDAPVHAWGSATTLIQFKDSPVLLDHLRGALARNQMGAVTIACFLIRNEQRSLLPQAIEAAQKLVIKPGSVNMSELQAASGLVRDYGNDDQFNALVATLRRLKTSDVEQYRKLFSSASYSENKREIELDAVLIDDMREGFPPMRYCDVAAATLQRLSGQDFGVVQNMTRPDWDRAVRRARDWLAGR